MKISMKFISNLKRMEAMFRDSERPHGREGDLENASEKWRRLCFLEKLKACLFYSSYEGWERRLMREEPTRPFEPSWEMLAREMLYLEAANYRAAIFVVFSERRGEGYGLKAESCLREKLRYRAARNILFYGCGYYDTETYHIEEALEAFSAWLCY